MGFDKNWPFFKIKFIAYNFFPRRDTKNLKTSLHFFRQDASKHVSGGLKKSNLKFDPRSGLLTLTHYVRILRPYRKSKSKFKTVFPLTEAYGTRIQQSLIANKRRCYSAPPPYCTYTYGIAVWLSLIWLALSLLVTALSDQLPSTGAVLTCCGTIWLVRHRAWHCMYGSV